MRKSVVLLGTAVIAAITVAGCKPASPPAKPDAEPVAPVAEPAKAAPEAATPAAGPAAPAAAKMLDAPKLFLPPLGKEINVPDGLALDKDNNVYLSVPNYVDPTNCPGKIMKITIAEDGAKSMQVFAMLPKHPESGMVHPMGLEFGPDGNLYIADNQYFISKDYKSRLLKLIVKDGKATNCVVAVDGFKLANAVRWKGNDVYVSDTFLDVPDKKHQSAIFRIGMDEMNAGTVHLDLKGKDAAPNTEGSHMIAQLTAKDFGGEDETAGADGVCFDSKGNLYTGNFGDGVMFRVSFDENGKVVKQETIADDPEMQCCDGITCDTTRDIIYIANSKRNSIHAMDAKTGKISLLWENDDNDGATGLLDQPCEPCLRGDELIVVNFDYCVPEWGLKNQGPDPVNTLSVLKLR